MIVLREEAHEKALALQNLFNEIYIRDITMRHRVKNVGELEELLNVLSSSIGSLTYGYIEKRIGEGEASLN